LVFSPCPIRGNNLTMTELSPFEIEALLLSLKVGVAATVFSLPFAVLVAWVLSRLRFPGKFLLDGITHLPLVLPPVVIGYVLLVLFGKNGPVGGWLYDVFGITIAFTWKGAAVASAVVAFPLMVRAIRLSFDNVDIKLEQAARTLGAKPVSIFFTITLPLILPGLLSGAVLAFARSLGEFGATITFVSNIPGVTQTLPLALYSSIQSFDGEFIALRLVIISVVLSLAAMLASEFLSRKLAGYLE